MIGFAFPMPSELQCAPELERPPCDMVEAACWSKRVLNLDMAGV